MPDGSRSALYITGRFLSGKGTKSKNFRKSYATEAIRPMDSSANLSHWKQPGYRSLKVLINLNTAHKEVLTWNCLKSLFPVARLHARGHRFEFCCLHQLALTKKMQARIPHFGAGFLY